MAEYFVDSEGRYLGAFEAAPGASYVLPQGAIEVPEAPQDARQIWSEGAWSPVPPDVPLVISDRQFFQQLALGNFITEAEALAAVMTGTIPGAMENLIASMPIADRFAARMLLAGATEFRRDNPLVAVFASANGLDDHAIDALWIAASAL